MGRLIKFSTPYNLIKRFLVSPFFLIIILIVTLIQSIRTWILFLRFGGEHIIYTSKDSASMEKIYRELKARKEDSDG